MNLSDLLKRVTEEDKRKVFIFMDRNGGWTNVNFTIDKSTIIITEDTNEIFSSDK